MLHRHVPHLLAYVLVHEITHVLQGTNRHSEMGIMKAAWDETDFFDMAHGQLQFSPEDVSLIYRGMDTRSTCQTANQSPEVPQ